MGIKKITLLFLILISLQISAQDTIPIFFKSGSTTLSQTAKLKLENIPKNYNLSKVDTIKFIGSSDSTGNAFINLILSKKRAKKAKSYCLFFKDDIYFMSHYLGEKLTGKLSSNRSVKVILNYKNDTIEKDIDVVDQDMDSIKQFKSFCYQVDYDLIRSSSIRKIKFNTGNFIYIEVEPGSHDVDSARFYAGFNKKDSSYSIEKLEWETATTGNFWWKKNRFSTKIPLQYWNQYRVFKKVDNCSSCANSFPTKPNDKFSKSLETDVFLMKNFQYKFNWFRSGYKVRIPREFVDEKTTYYTGCSDNNKKIKWKRKRFGKRKNYYYTRLSSKKRNNCAANITKETLHCKADKSSTCDNCFIKCGTPSGGDCFDSKYRVAIEYGLLPLKTSLGFIGASIGIDKKKYFSKLTIGSNEQLHLHIQGQYSRYLIHFPNSALNFLKPWQNPSNSPIKSLGSLYTGIQYRTTFDNPISESKTNLNLHFGYAYHKIRYNFYCQSGLQYNFSANQFQPMIQIGGSIKLFSLR